MWAKTFGVLFLLTGFFAIAGGLYTWGDGSIFTQNELTKVLIPLADIILTGPISICCGYGILKDLSLSKNLGLVTSGIYLFGSVLVFITVFWNTDYSVFLIVPALSGLLISLGFIAWIYQTSSYKNET